MPNNICKCPKCGSTNTVVTYHCSACGNTWNVNQPPAGQDGQPFPIPCPGCQTVTKPSLWKCLNPGCDFVRDYNRNPGPWK